MAKTWLEDFDGVPTFVTERYDRVLDGGRIRRIHQEDLCQALSVPPEKKYQRHDGGPGVAEVARLISRFGSPEDRATVAHDFYKWLVFNVLVHGTNAHAKNFSLILDGRSIRSSPFYDLASYLPYRADGETTYSSMKIGGEYRFSAIGQPQLLSAAGQLRLDASWAESEFRRQSSGILRAVEAASSGLLRAGQRGEQMVDRLVAELAASPHVDQNRQ